MSQDSGSIGVEQLWHYSFELWGGERMNRQHEFSLPVATGLLVVTALAMLMTGWRWWGFRNDLAAAEKAAKSSGDEATQSILNSFSLPVNRPLRICNQTGRELKVMTLAASYWGRDGTLKQFNSAEHAWHVWTINRSEAEKMRFDGIEPWEGSAIFYAAEVERAGGGRSLLAGTSDDLKVNACINVTKE
jgi:hypothetical protein